MTGELDAIARANPVAESTMADVEAAVALDRRELLDLLAEDDQIAPPRPVRRRRIGTSGTRVGYAGALTAAAAAVVAIVMLGTDDQPLDRAPVESAEEGSTATSPTDGTGSLPPSTTLQVVVTTPDGPNPEPSADEASATTTVPPTSSPETSTSGSTPATTPTRTEGPFDPSADLLSIHFDFSNPDDGHATVAARELATSFGLVPHVVGGTADPNSEVFVNAYAPVMGAAWGQAWLDAGSDRPDAVATTSQRWLATIDAGGRVWVAEGGVSDFTAEVVQEIGRRRPELATNAAILVIQHNGRNESAAMAGALTTVQESTDYTRIDDGNSVNETADLFQPSPTFEATALAGPNAAAWSLAFTTLPAAELDFSDTVEVLHILGVGLDQVATPDDFARRFMG